MYGLINVCLSRISQYCTEMGIKTINNVLRTSLLVGAFACNTVLAPAELLAATQGTLGATSTGSLTISVTKPARADITNLTDLTVASWVTGGGDQTLTSDVCVYSTRPTGGYTIKAPGRGTSSAFTLANGANTLAYSVSWNSGGVGALTNTGTALTTNVTSAALTKAATDSSTCTGTVPGATARLIVTILATNLDAIVDGTYTGTLTLLVTPN